MDAHSRAKAGQWWQSVSGVRVSPSSALSVGWCGRGRVGDDGFVGAKFYRPMVLAPGVRLGFVVRIGRAGCFALLCFALYRQQAQEIIFFTKYYLCFKE
jgi:hypothetical protein